MKEHIAELRSAIRRLGPQLLLRDDGDDGRPPPSSPSATWPPPAPRSPDAVAAAAAHDGARPSPPPDGGRDGDGAPPSPSPHRLRDALRREAAAELADAAASLAWELDCRWSTAPATEGRDSDEDEDAAASLVREGYGLIATAGRTPPRTEGGGGDGAADRDAPSRRRHREALYVTATRAGRQAPRYGH